MNTSWHLDAELARLYAAGRASHVLASSADQHLLECAPCRALVATAVPVPRLDRVWEGVLERVEAPQPRAVERLLHRAGVAESTARLLAGTPSLRSSWFLGVTLVLVMAIVVSHVGQRGVAVFLMLAPVLPMLGVAVAFSPLTDPLHEVAAATPYGAVRLLMVRGLAVVTPTLALAGVTAALLPGTTWAAAAWLLPALALTASTLALATRIDPARAGGALTVAWLAVTAPALLPGQDPLVATRSAVQLVSLALLLVATAVLVLRRAEFSATSWRSS